MSRQGEEALRNSLIMRLILSYLPVSDIKAVSQVCRSWRDLTNQARYWRSCHVTLYREGIIFYI